MPPLNKAAKTVSLMTGFFKTEYLPEPIFFNHAFEKCMPKNMISEEAKSIGYAIKTALGLKGKTAICPMRVTNPTKPPILNPKSRNAITTGI
jgi:hypothetical protein